MKRLGVAWMLAAVLVLVLGSSGQALALDKFEASLKVKEATIMIQRFMKSPDAGAPRWLLQRCKAVLIMPNLVKGGFVIGAKYGHGVISVRGKDGKWSAPSFVELAGGNIGFQIGAESVDLFMVFMNQRGLKGITSDEVVRWGANASVAAGPVGRSADAGITGASTKADVYSYSRSKGAFAGATIGGEGFEIDKGTNKAYYGKSLSAADILYKGKAPLHAEAKELVKALGKYSQK